MVLVAEEKSTTYSINTAFVGISRRAESVDRKTLVQTFVDLGPLIPVLSSRDHQIVYGRRGTGKTHALLYVTEQLKADRVVPVYVDLRNMGSSGGIYADAQIPLTQRATRLLLDVLGDVHEGLVEHAVTADLDLAVLYWISSPSP
jgi:Cdc6-like AAA superfamily ATPase